MARSRIQLVRDTSHQAEFYGSRHRHYDVYYKGVGTEGWTQITVTHEPIEEEDGRTTWWWMVIDHGKGGGAKAFPTLKEAKRQAAKWARLVGR